MALEYNLSRFDFISDLNKSRYNLKNQDSKIAKHPLKQIQCESIADDFYCNHLDWSGNTVFYCADNKVFAYNFHSGKNEVLFIPHGIVITSIKHSRQTNILCIGTSSGSICFLDINTLKYSKIVVHRSRIGAIETMGSSIISGSRDRKSRIIDLRSNQQTALLSFHSQEVCGLSINSKEKYLASGGNDNKVFIYDMNNLSLPLLKFEDHRAAIRALSWSPLISTQLISGGGTADKTIKHWDIKNPDPLVGSYNFESQICNLKWLDNNKILGTFGYSNDDIKLISNFKIEKRFQGHKNRVIHFSVDQQQRFFASAGGDSKINIWEIDERDTFGDIEIR